MIKAKYFDSYYAGMQSSRGLYLVIINIINSIYFCILGP